MGNYAYDESRKCFTFNNVTSTAVGSAIDSTEETQVVTAVSAVLFSVNPEGSGTVGTCVLVSATNSQLVLKAGQYELVFS